MRQALAASGLRTKRAVVVEEALRLLLRLKQQEQLKTAFGQLPGTVTSMRCVATTSVNDNSLYRHVRLDRFLQRPVTLETVAFARKAPLFSVMPWEAPPCALAPLFLP